MSSATIESKSKPVSQQGSLGTITMTMPPKSEPVSRQGSSAAITPQNKPVSRQGSSATIPPQSKPVSRQGSSATIPPQSKPVSRQGSSAAITPQNKPGSRAASSASVNTPEGTLSRKVSSTTVQRTDTSALSAPSVAPSAFENLSFEVLEAHNRLLAYFVELLRADMPYFDNETKELCRPGQAPLATMEGRRAWEEAVDVLKAMKTGELPPFKWSAHLARPAIAHCKDIGDAGTYSHSGSDDAGVMARVGKYCKPKAALAQSLDFAHWTADEIVAHMFVDDGFAGRGHRANILNPDMKVLGVACGPHAKRHIGCVAVYAGRAVGMDEEYKKANPTLFDVTFAQGDLPTKPDILRQMSKQMSMAATISTREGSLGDTSEEGNAEGDFEEIKDLFPEWAKTVDNSSKVTEKAVAGKIVVTRVTTINYTTYAGTSVRREVTQTRRFMKDGTVQNTTMQTARGDPKYAKQWIM